MKLFKGFALLGAFLVLAGCSASGSGGSAGGGGNGGGSSIIGGDASSANGKAWIAAIRGKLYEAKEEPADSGVWVADETRAIPVANNGDLTGEHAIYGDPTKFAGAPTKTSAFYYVGEGAPAVPNAVQGLIIEGNIVYYVTPKKSEEIIAKELGLPEHDYDWTEEQFTKFQRNYYIPSNFDMAAPWKDSSGRPAFGIKP